MRESANEDVRQFVEGLNYAEKVGRSLELIDPAWQEYGDRLVVANSPGKDSVVVRDLAKRVSREIRGFIVTMRFKPNETVAFMKEQVAQYPELRVFQNEVSIPEKLYESDPDRCCDLLKAEPTRRAMGRDQQMRQRMRDSYTAPAADRGRGRQIGRF